MAAQKQSLQAALATQLAERAAGRGQRAADQKAELAHINDSIEVSLMHMRARVKFCPHLTEAILGLTSLSDR